MIVQNEYVVELSELKLLSIVCKACTAELVMDISRANAKSPVQCGSCDKAFDVTFLEPLDLFIRAYKNLAVPTNATARIRIRQA